MKTHIEFKRYIKNDPSQIREIDFYSDGTKQWFLNGNRFLSEIDYWEVVEKYKKNRKNTK